MKKVLCLLGCLFAANAQATVIDFEEIRTGLSESRNYISGNTLNSRGFTLQASSNWFGLANYPSQFSGPSSTFLLLDDNTGWKNTSTTLSLYAADGNLFSLAGFDFSSWGDDEESASKIQVTGHSATGTQTLALTINTHDRSFLQTATNQFAGWNNLSSISFNALTSSGASFNWALDNIRVNENAVPEPANLALLGLGLASMSLVARRRKKN